MEVIRKKLGGLKSKLDEAERQATATEEELNSINEKADSVWVHFFIFSWFSFVIKISSGTLLGLNFADLSVI